MCHQLRCGHHERQLEVLAGVAEFLSRNPRVGQLLLGSLHSDRESSFLELERMILKGLVRFVVLFGVESYLGLDFLYEGLAHNVLVGRIAVADQHFE